MQNGTFCTQELFATLSLAILSKNFLNSGTKAFYDELLKKW